jgi:hypothetical protein
MGVCFTKKKTVSAYKANSSDLNNSLLENFQFYSKLKEDRNYKLLVIKVKWPKSLAKLYLTHEGYINIHEKRNYSFSQSNNTTAVSSDIAIVSLKVSLITDYLCKAKGILMTELLVSGPPNNIRWLIWISLVKTKYSFCNNEKIYSELIAQELREEIVFQINKDLHRTCPENKYFQTEEGLKTLYNILKAIALYDQRVSYCQGLNILAANILLLSDGNEIETFYFLRYLLESLNVRDFYTRGFPKLHRYIYILKRFIQEKFVNVYNKIESIGLPDEVWLFKWLQTLFSLSVDFSIGVRLWDCIIAQNDLVFIIKFCLALIKTFEGEILKSLDMSEFMDAFKIKITKITKDEDIITLRENLLTTALQISIDNFDNFANEYDRLCTNQYKDDLSISQVTNNRAPSLFFRDMNGEIVTSIKRSQSIYETKDKVFLGTSVGSLPVEDEMSASIKRVNVLEYKRNYFPRESKPMKKSTN